MFLRIGPKGLRGLARKKSGNGVVGWRREGAKGKMRVGPSFVAMGVDSGGAAPKESDGGELGWIGFDLVCASSRWFWASHGSKF